MCPEPLELVFLVSVDSLLIGEEKKAYPVKSDCSVNAKSANAGIAKADDIINVVINFLFKITFLYVI